MQKGIDLKFIEAVQLICNRIDQAVELDEIASSIGVSVSTLKRIFKEICGTSPGAFIRRLRLEFAFKSLKQQSDSVLETALAIGFQDHAAFSRSFKKVFGYSPSVARSKINLIQEFEKITLGEPEVVEIVPIALQSVTQKGLYFECAPAAWDLLSRALTSAELGDDFAGVFIGIGHDNPHLGGVHEDQVRFTAGVSMLERDLHLTKMSLAGGRYAKFTYVGRLVNLGMAYHFIFGEWRSTSGLEIRQDQPPFLVFDRFPEMTSDHRVMIQVPIE